MHTPPVMKSDIAISHINYRYRHISIDGSAHKTEPLARFGRLSVHSAESYDLFVDSRFDFNEVLEYIRALETDRTLFGFGEGWTARG